MSLTHWRRLLPAVGLALAACTGGPDPFEPTLVLVSPRAGATLGLADDLDARADGIQLEAEVRATGLDGAVVTLAVKDAASPLASARIAVNGAKLPFTLPGTAILVATAVAADGRRIQSEPAPVTFDPSARTCRIAAPADGATLGADESTTDGFQTTVRVRCAGVESGNPVVLAVGGLRWAQAPLGAGGQVVFPAVELAEGLNVISVTTKTDAGDAVRGESTVTVSTGACRLVLSPGSGTVFNARGEGDNAVADLTPGAPMDARLALDASCAGATVELRRGSVKLAEKVVVAGENAFEVSLPDATNLELRAVAVGDAKGASPLVRYIVDAVVPAATLAFPTSGKTFTDADDARPAEAGLQLLVKGSFTGIPGSTAFELVLENAEGTQSTLAGTLAATGTFEVPVTFANGKHKLFARARRPSGTTARSDTATFETRYRGTSLAFQAPRAGDALGLAADADAQTPGFQLGLTLVATNLENGTGTVTCGGASAPVTLANGRATVLLDVAAVGCAGTRLSCTAAIGEVEATVSDLLVDPTPPVVTLVSPRDGDQLATTSVSVEATSDCPGESQTAVLLRGGASFAELPATTGNEFSFRDLTLPARESAFTLRVADAAGNETEVAFTVFVDADVPQPIFVAPAADAQFAAADDQRGDLGDGFQREIVIEVPNETAGTLVELQVGGRAPVSARTVDENGSKIARFEAVTFPEGESTVRACATDDAGGVGCASLKVTLSTGRPTCSIATPVDGRVLGRRDDLSQADAGVQFDVEVQTNAGDGAVVSLAIADPGGARRTLSATAQGGKATLAATTFATEGDYVLTATCASPTGASGVSLDNDLSVDFTAPAFEVLEPVADAVYNLASPDRGSAAGFQIDVKVQALEPSTGALVGLEVSCGEGPRTITPVAINTQQTATFRAVSMPDVADCDLTITLEDAAGNTSSPVVRRVRIDRKAPVLQVLGPVNGVKLGLSSDADVSTAGFQLAAATVGFDEGSAAELLVNGTATTAALQLTATRATWNRVTLREGANTLLFSVSDAAGNRTQASVTATVDTTSPVVSILAPASARTYARALDASATEAGLQLNVQLRTDFIDDDATIELCSPQAPAGASACRTSGMRRLGSPVVVAGGSANITGVTFPEGQVTLVAEAKETSGNEAASSPVSFIVDTVGPVVTSLRLVKVSGEAESALSPLDGTKSFGIADDSGPASGFQARLKATLTGAESGQKAQFFTSIPANPTLLGEATLAADGTAQLDLVTLVDGVHALYVVAKDAAGNESSGPGRVFDGVQPTVASFGIDTAAPEIRIVTPAAGALLAKDDTGPGAGLQVDVVVQTNAGDGRPVQILVDGTPVGSPVPVPTGASRVTVTGITLGDGARTVTAQVSDTVGNTSLSAEVAYVVDAIAPVVAITAPVAGAGLGEDADQAEPGFQALVSVTYGQVEAARPLKVFSTQGGLVAEGSTNASGTAQFTVTLLGGAQVLTAELSDVSGNLTTSTPVSITVNTSAPGIRFASVVSPLAFGLENDKNPAAAGCQVELEVASDRNGAVVTLLVEGQPAAGVATATIANGVATLTGLTLADGASVSLQLKAQEGTAVGLSPVRRAICDLSAPTVAFVTPAAGQLAVFVAKGTVGGPAGAIEDAAEGDELDASFTIALTGLDAGTVTLSSNLDGELASRTFTSAPAGNVVLTVSKTVRSARHTLTLKAVDAAGNLGQATLSADIDVVAPAAITPTVNVTDRRATVVDLSFTAPGSDGDAGAKVQSYEVRWAPTKITDAAGWAAVPADRRRAFTTNLVDPGAVQKLSIDGLPFETSWFFAVRANDVLRNASPVTTSTAGDLMLARTIRTDAPAVSSEVFQKSVVGDLDGDGKEDLIVGTAVDASTSATPNNGRVDVYYGGSAIGTPVTLRDPRLTDSRFGYAVATGDVDGDDLTDLLVGAYLAKFGAAPAPGATDTRTNDGAVYVYFGRANVKLTATSTPDLTIQGPANTNVASAQIRGGFGSRIIVTKDFTGDLKPDLVVAAEAGAARQGRVYAFAGRARTDWGSSVLAATTALAVLKPHVTTAPGPSLGEELVSLGSIDDDKLGDFAMSAPISSDVAFRAPVYVVSGAKLAAAATAAGGTAPEIAADTVGRVITCQASDSVCGGVAANQFGLALAAGDVTGDDVADLVVSHHVARRALVFSGSELGAWMDATGAGTQPDAKALTIPSGEYGREVFVLPDVTGDEIGDIAVSFISTTPIKYVHLWAGRSSGSWTTPFVTINKGARETIGTTVAAGKLLGKATREIVVMDREGGLTFLSDP